MAAENQLGNSVAPHYVKVVRRTSRRVTTEFISKVFGIWWKQELIHVISQKNPLERMKSLNGASAVLCRCTAADKKE